MRSFMFAAMVFAALIFGPLARAQTSIVPNSGGLVTGPTPPVGAVFMTSPNAWLMVCPGPTDFQTSDAVCPEIRVKAKVTVLRTGLPQSVFGSNATVVEISVEVPGYSTNVGWTEALMLDELNGRVRN